MHIYSWSDRTFPYLTIPRVQHYLQWERRPEDWFAGTAPESSNSWNFSRENLLNLVVGVVWKQSSLPEDQVD